MGNIQDKLNYLSNTKEAIKQAIITKGVDVTDSDTFRSYADKIDSIQTGGGGGGEYELPSHLTQIEYIQQDAGVSSSGYPIPYIPNMNTRLEMKFAIVGWSSSSTSNHRQVFGGYTGNSGDNIFGLVATKNDNKLTPTYGTVLENRKYAKLGTPALNTDYTLIMTTSKVTLNNIDYEYEYLETADPLPNTWVADNPLYIFPGAPVSVSYISWNKLYYAKVYDGDVLKYDLIPVKNNTSGYGGLFDRVTGGYFENTDYVYSFENGPEVHTFTINSTPSNATVSLACSHHIQEGNSIKSPPNGDIAYIVSADGYITQTGSYTMGSADVTLDITLEKDFNSGGGDEPTGDTAIITLNPIDGGTITNIQTVDSSITSDSSIITVPINTPVVATTSNGTKLYAISNRTGHQTVDVYTTDISTSDEADTIGKVYVYGNNDTDTLSLNITYEGGWGPDEYTDSYSGTGSIIADPRNTGDDFGYSGIYQINTATATATNSNGISSITFETKSIFNAIYDASFKSGHYIILSSP